MGDVQWLPPQAPDGQEPPRYQDVPEGQEPLPPARPFEAPRNPPRGRAVLERVGELPPFTVPVPAGGPPAATVPSAPVPGGPPSAPGAAPHGPAAPPAGAPAGPNPVPAGPAPYPRPAKPTGPRNRAAMQSLMLGVAGLCFLFLTGFVGFAIAVPCSFAAWHYGKQARRELAADPNQAGRTQAEFGYWLGIVGFILGILATILVLTIVATGFDVEKFTDDLRERVEQQRSR